jgi:hypothetical protein
MVICFGVQQGKSFQAPIVDSKDEAMVMGFMDGELRMHFCKHRKVDMPSFDKQDMMGIDNTSLF